MRDRRHKAAALRYAVSKRWFPQLELRVQPFKSSDDQSYEITDIDVFAAAPSDLDAFNIYLFDCKSGKHSSPISRALWLKGLLSHVEGDRGICIVSSDKNISIDHRNTADDIDVSIMTLDEFKSFANSTGGDSVNGNSNLSDIDKWDTYINYQDKYNQLSGLIEFSQSDFWKLETSGDQCRQVISQLRKFNGDLDPDKRSHNIIFGDLLSLFLYSSTQIGHTLFNAYQHPSNIEELKKVLLYELYNGRETYTLLNNIRDSVYGNSSDVSNLTLPMWDKFTQFIRGLMDSPLKALHSPLLARETAWSLLDDNRNYSFETAQTIVDGNPQSAKYCLIASRYLTSACNLPPEFGELYKNVLMPLQSSNKKGLTVKQARLDFSS